MSQVAWPCYRGLYFRLQTHANMQFANGNAKTSKRIRSPPLAFESNCSVQKPDFSPEEVQRKSPINYDEFPPQLSNHQVVSYFDAHDSGTLSPSKPFFRNETKRARSPGPAVGDLATSSTQFDSERKMQAKAKWLACFNVELSQPIHLHDLVKHKPSGNKENQASLDKCNVDEHTELACDLSSGEDLFDVEGPESSQVVVGSRYVSRYVQESERKERERKGHLDRYECLDGERNQTTKLLTVKKVGPAELSFDLAKMIPEIRCTPEILFARDVARACRIVKQHLFLQIRMQALASLHRGLQENKGIPIAHIVDWLGMEEEDVEGLLKYHGFVSKKYEEMYMVKEGPFLNGDVDFPTKCARLVHLKKSKRIIDDVCSDPKILNLSEETEVASDVPDIMFQRTESSKTEDSVNIGNEEVRDYKSDNDLRAVTQTEQLLEGPLPATVVEENDAKMTEVFPVFASCATEDDSVHNNEDEQITELDGDTFMGQGILPQMVTTIVQAGVARFSNSKLIIENTAPQTEVASNVADSILQRTESSKTEDWVNTSNEEVCDYKSDNDLRAIIQTEQLLEGPLPATVIEKNDTKMIEVFSPFASCATENGSVHNDEDEQMSELDGDTSMGQGILPQMETTVVQAGVPGFPNSKLIVENTAP
ncbi:hypothetical protein COCNU_scaffold001294G000020 [Cocos nucifera]|nr:hypothetical protein [Cocos nucifera]